MNGKTLNQVDSRPGKETASLNTKRATRRRWQYTWLPSIVLIPLLISGVTPQTRPQGGYITDVREIETTDELGVASPVGLAYSPQAEVFEVIDRSANGASGPTVAEMSMYEQLAGKATLAGKLSDPLNIAFNGKKNSLFHLNLGANTLDEFPAEASGKLPSAAAAPARFDTGAYGLVQAEGMTFNPADGSLYLLDPAGKRMVRVTPDANGNYDGTPAATEGRLQRIDLKQLGASHLRGIAFNPASGHLFVLGPKEKTLFEITENGALVDTFDVSTFTLRDPGAMVFAPSGDNTDDPSIQDLFIADSGQAKVQGQASGTGQVLELSLTAPTLLALPPLRTDITQLQMIQTSKWSPSSPDPAGLEYRTTVPNGELFVTDSEVDEMTIWKGVNAFQSTTTGTLTGTCNTSSFSKEIAGTAENPTNKHLFISDDGRKKIFEIDLGADGKYCTGDDKVRGFDAFALYNDTDPEGLAYGNGKLFATDGLGTEVYVIAPGNNGTFGDSDDQVTHFDTASMGIGDPEGIGYSMTRNSLFIVSRKRADKTMVETSVDGTVLNRFDISPFSILHPAGVGCGPNSIFVSDRGVDNNNDPNENDGKIFEFSVGN